MKYWRQLRKPGLIKGASDGFAAEVMVPTWVERCRALTPVMARLWVIAIGERPTKPRTAAVSVKETRCGPRP